MPKGKSRLVNKVAIVTGAGSSGPGFGTGKASSILFAREGASVLLVDQKSERASETLKLITEEHGTASIFEADVTNSDDCHAMVNAAIDRYGRLDILMNNAAIIRGGSVIDVDEDDWDDVMDTNVKGAMLASKHAIPRMINGSGGSIINMSSIEAIRSGTFAPITPYTVSKGSVITLTIAMSVQHGRDNVRVNCISPGYIYTPMVSPHLTDKVRGIRKNAAPLGTEGSAWDIAYAALFLASDEARWITGISLPVDAGLSVASTISMLPYLT